MRVAGCIALVTALGCSGPGGSNSDGNGSGDGPPFSTNGSGPYFTQPMFWNIDVSNTPKASYSDATIAALRAAGGWGNGDVFQIDYSITVLIADNSTPTRTFTKTGDFFTPDCDFMPIPVPTTGNVEGETGYACTHNGDCHLLV